LKQIFQLNNLPEFTCAWLSWQVEAAERFYSASRIWGNQSCYNLLVRFQEPSHV
jgi:hypothetical protein